MNTFEQSIFEQSIFESPMSEQSISNQFERLTNPLMQILPIIKIEDIGMTNLDVAYVLSYRTLIPKGLYNESDQIIYIFNDVEVDTNHPIFDFMKPKKKIKI